MLPQGPLLLRHQLLRRRKNNGPWLLRSFGRRGSACAVRRRRSAAVPICYSKEGASVPQTWHRKIPRTRNGNDMRLARAYCYENKKNTEFNWPHSARTQPDHVGGWSRWRWRRLPRGWRFRRWRFPRRWLSWCRPRRRHSLRPSARTLRRGESKPFRRRPALRRRDGCVANKTARLFGTKPWNQSPCWFEPHAQSCRDGFGHASVENIPATWIERKDRSH